MTDAANVVTFVAGEALYAVPVARVQEILDLRPVAPMPNAPAYLLGMIDLRGANVPVVDLRIILGLSASTDSGQIRILVLWIDHGGQRAVVGLKTDRVIEVTALDDQDLRPLAEAELLRWSGSAIAGIGRRNGDLVSVLDLDRLFPSLPAAPKDAAPVPEDAAA